MRAFVLGVDHLSTDQLGLALSLRSRFFTGDAPGALLEERARGAGLTPMH